MSGYIDVDDYQSSPRATDPAELLEEEKLRTFELRRLLAERDAELVDRERQVGELLREIVGIE